MPEFTTPETKACTICGNIYPATLDFFYQNRKNAHGGVILKALCRNCSKEKRKETYAMRRNHPTHRREGEDRNGFQWNKLTQARFKNIAKTIQQRNLTPEQVLALSWTKARELSYRLGEELKVVKYTIREKHLEAMQILWPADISTGVQHDTYLEQIDNHVQEQDEEHDTSADFYFPEGDTPKPMTLRTAAENLIDSETRLDYALTDLEEARKMLSEAEDAVRTIKAERNEAVRFLADFAKELNFNDD